MPRVQPPLNVNVTLSCVSLLRAVADVDALSGRISCRGSDGSVKLLHIKSLSDLYFLKRVREDAERRGNPQSSDGPSNRKIKIYIVTIRRVPNPIHSRFATLLPEYPSCPHP